ncbi:MAG: hypothetical protein A2065_02405 [Alphaproteobacteria bacterium GWB1_45_5]|nr:MAG: hypothetical protein A2065_02405 [Alphaproteobacteria bacterium GWB1_45_5]
MKIKIFFNSVFLLMLTSCSSFKEKIGITHYAPNEFETVQNEPLEIPPSLNIENPEEGPYKRKKSTAEKARGLLIPASKALPASSSDHKAEQILLEKIGSDKRNPNIRRAIDRDNHAEPTMQEKIQRTLVFWKKPEKGTIIDPRKEQEKLETESSVEDK